jgi:uncharacterized membrane protein YeaQ/YmgE (transglycosylase-associated protein family)
MTLFAAIVLDPGTLVAWLIVGVICAWLLSKALGEATYGIMGDMFVGAVGAFVGGCIFGLMVDGNPAFWGSMLLALLGGCVLIGAARAIAARRA